MKKQAAYMLLMCLFTAAFIFAWLTKGTAINRNIQKNVVAFSNK